MDYEILLEELTMNGFGFNEEDIDTVLSELENYNNMDLDEIIGTLIAADAVKAL